MEDKELRERIEEIINARVATEIAREEELKKGLQRRDMGRSANIILDSQRISSLIAQAREEEGKAVAEEIRKAASTYSSDDRNDPDYTYMSVEITEINRIIASRYGREEGDDNE